jgi:hypothetical protein
MKKINLVLLLILIFSFSACRDDYSRSNFDLSNSKIDNHNINEDFQLKTTLVDSEYLKIEQIALGASKNKNYPDFDQLYNHGFARFSPDYPCADASMDSGQCEFVLQDGTAYLFKKSSLNESTYQLFINNILVWEEELNYTTFVSFN